MRRLTEAKMRSLEKRVGKMLAGAKEPVANTNLSDRLLGVRDRLAEVLLRLGQTSNSLSQQPCGAGESEDWAGDLLTLLDRIDRIVADVAEEAARISRLVGSLGCDGKGESR